MIAFQKQPIFLLNGEVIWQVCDSSESKDLHAVIRFRFAPVLTYYGQCKSSQSTKS